MALRCLIVDDSPSFVDAACPLLERQGVDVVGTPATSAEALACMAEPVPDVVLVDVMLGEESGFERARRLNERGARIVMISTHAESDLNELLASSPAAGFVAWPSSLPTGRAAS